MFINFYRIISDLLFIPILIYFSIRLLLSKEKVLSILEKFNLSKKKRPKGDLVWINAVSVGEAKTGLIIAKKIKKNNPDINILFSTSTLTSYNILSEKKRKKFFINFHSFRYKPCDNKIYKKMEAKFNNFY